MQSDPSSLIYLFLKRHCGHSFYTLHRRKDKGESHWLGFWLWLPAARVLSGMLGRQKVIEVKCSINIKCKFLCPTNTHISLVKEQPISVRGCSHEYFKGYKPRETVW